mgnify:CR=1 FL=1
MKESGIDWIGQIPQEWEVIKFKYLGDVKQGLTYSPSDIVDKDEGILVLRSGNIQNGVLDFTNNVYVKTKVAESIVLRKNDILITARNGSSALIGKNAIIDTDIKATFGAFMMVFRTNKSLIAKFAFYLMNISFNFYRTFFTTSTVNQLTAAIFNGIEVPLPSISEQQKIADFLDKKTAQLDKVKSLLEEQIQKLKDYRSSLIYETVTKGLDKTVPLKDSGIDWIGQVPEGWGVSRLKYFFDIYAGGDIDERNTVDEYSENHPYPVISNSLENEGILGYTNNFRFQGDSVTVTGRGDVGKAVYRNIEFYPVVRLLVCIPKKQVDCRFVTYWINSAIIEKNQTAVSQLTIQMLGELIFTKVPYVEQKKIADFLDEKTIQIDKLIQIKNEQIKNINKQRQTLIYDYVTGKRRVY